MPYSEFTNLSKLRYHFNIRNQAKRWFEAEKINKIEPSQWLLRDINFGLKEPLNTEKARSENLISPIIKEIKIKNEAYITYFSGYGFNVDEKKGLNGHCDYIIAAKPAIADVESPIFCLVEAKNGVVEDGYAQCGAEMYAAKLFNEQYGDAIDIIYGACTNGYEWVFLKLEEEVLYIDNQKILISDLPAILGVLQYMVEQYKN